MNGKFASREAKVCQAVTSNRVRVPLARLVSADPVIRMMDALTLTLTPEKKETSCTSASHVIALLWLCLLKRRPLLKSCFSTLEPTEAMRVELAGAISMWVVVILIDTSLSVRSV